MKLLPDGEDGFISQGKKYYIGNGNEAALASTFGKKTNTDDYVFFGVHSNHSNYHLLQNTASHQKYVS
jgi:acyl-CoA dehydrogenase